MDTMLVYIYFVMLLDLVALFWYRCIHINARERNLNVFFNINIIMSMSFLMILHLLSRSFDTKEEPLDRFEAHHVIFIR